MVVLSSSKSVSLRAEPLLCVFFQLKALLTDDELDELNAMEEGDVDADIAFDVSGILHSTSVTLH